MAVLPAIGQNHGTQNDVDSSLFGGTWMVSERTPSSLGYMFDHAQGSQWYIEFDGKRLSITRYGKPLPLEAIQYGQGVLSFRTVEYLSYEGEMAAALGNMVNVTSEYRIHLIGSDQIVGTWSREYLSASQFYGIKRYYSQGTIEMVRMIASPSR
jgi:hypothetical protein